MVGLLIVMWAVTLMLTGIICYKKGQENVKNNDKNKEIL